MSKQADKENTFTISILKVFANNPFDSFNYKQISSRVGAADRAARQLVQNTILRLAEDKRIIEDGRGKYKINPKSIDDSLMPKNYLIGTIDMKQTGKAYLLPESDDMDDVFISANNTKNALHGDKVKVMLFPQRKGRKKEGQVVEVLQRNKMKYVGTISIQDRFATLIPDSRFMPIDIIVPKEDLNGAKNGEKVLVEITEWQERMRNPVGKVINILGQPGSNNVEILSILAEYDFPLNFPKAVEKAAEKIPETISEEEIAKRRDFRNVITFTIDPADAKDFDDAISYRELENGNKEIGVHIADVSHYVRPEDEIDNEGYLRATSVYLVDRTIPMLPEKLSNKVCSLRPNEEKLCFSAVFEMNSKAEVVDQWFGKTIINSDHRFTYEEAQQVIETNEGPFSKEILGTHALAQIMREQRYKNGAINFESKEVKFILDENAKPIGVYIKESKEANFLIEEFMLLANKKVAEFVGKRKEQKAAKTFVYRVHDEPNPEKLNTFVQFVTKLGYKMKITSRNALASSFNNLFKEIEGKGEENMIDTIAIRTMAKAYYSTENIGHYGLAFPYYTHFTSPIRRYPDLMVHRLLERYLDGGTSANQDEYEEKCKHSSLMERKATEAERASIKYKQAEYLSDKIGEVFTGKISGVSKWGIYVEIDENKSEGMIRLESLKDDYYYLDEDNYQVIGRRYGKVYKLGSAITIRVKGVDMQKKQIDFEHVDDENNAEYAPDWNPPKEKRSYPTDGRNASPRRQSSSRKPKSGNPKGKSSRSRKKK